MTTLDGVTKKKPAEQSAEQQVAAELVRLAQEQGLSLTGPDGLLKQLTKTVLETALNEEMTVHLGYAKHDPPGATAQLRNGARAKTVLTDIRARWRSTSPATGTRRRAADGAQAPTPPVGLDGLVISLSAKGLTTARSARTSPRCTAPQVSKRPSAGSPTG